MENIHYLDGKWYPTDKLHVSAFDLSVIRGYGIFDFLRTYNRKPFTLEAHIDRLFNSAKMLGLNVPESKKEIARIIYQGIDKNKDTSEFNIRIVVTGGVGPDSLTPGNPSLVITFTPAVDYPKEFYEKGIRVNTYSTKRVFPGAKTLNYLSAIIALQEAKKQKAIEVIYVGDDGQIYEGTTSNFFAVLDDTLVTPKEGILYGITRKLVLDIASKLKIKTVERKLYTPEIPKFQEAFVTASNKEIMPVIMIDKIKIGNSLIGEVTRKLTAEYDKLKQ